MAASLIRRRFLAVLAAGFAAACTTLPDTQSDARPGTDEPAALTRILLVRHGEKETGPDPLLSADGEVRARQLVERLAPEGVSEIWSTATRRTQATARPMADATGLPTLIYDPSAMPDFARDLAATPGVKLVIGHSNTTDALAALMGADPGPPINDATEFDRLYVITLRDGHEVLSEIQRYGAPSATGTP